MESKLAKKEGECKTGLRVINDLIGPMNCGTQRYRSFVGYRVQKNVSCNTEGGGKTVDTRN